MNELFQCRKVQQVRLNMTFLVFVLWIWTTCSTQYLLVNAVDDFSSGDADPSGRLALSKFQLGLNPFGKSILDPDLLALLQNIPGLPGVDYPIYATVPKTPFKCRLQYPSSGYFADTDARCQVFHICQEDGRMDSFLCPNGTVFSQRYFVCVWWNNFDCNTARALYALNQQFGKEGEQDSGEEYDDQFNGYSRNRGNSNSQGAGDKGGYDENLSGFKNLNNAKFNSNRNQAEQFNDQFNNDKFNNDQFNNDKFNNDQFSNDKFSGQMYLPPSQDDTTGTFNAYEENNGRKNSNYNSKNEEMRNRMRSGKTGSLESDRQYLPPQTSGKGSFDGQNPQRNSAKKSREDFEERRDIEVSDQKSLPPSAPYRYGKNIQLEKIVEIANRQYLPPVNRNDETNRKYLPPSPSRDIDTDGYVYPVPSRQYLPSANRRYLPPTGDEFTGEVPESREYLPPDSGYIPPIDDYLSFNNEYLPPSGEYLPPNNEYLPPSNDYISPSKEYLPPGNSDREYLPPARKADKGSYSTRKNSKGYSRHEGFNAADREYLPPSSPENFNGYPKSRKYLPPDSPDQLDAIIIDRNISVKQNAVIQSRYQSEDRNIVIPSREYLPSQSAYIEAPEEHNHGGYGRSGQAGDRNFNGYEKIRFENSVTREYLPPQARDFNGYHQAQSKHGRNGATNREYLPPSAAGYIDVEDEDQNFSGYPRFKNKYGDTPSNREYLPPTDYGRGYVTNSAVVSKILEYLPPQIIEF